MWKNEKFALTEKLFRQINSLVISLVKMLLSRNFCQRSVRERISVISTLLLLCALTEKIFLEINSLVKKPLVSRKFCQKCVKVNFRNFKFHYKISQVAEFYRSLYLA